ncbi:hypothetical protein HDV64DRAFT_133718 [Trichoderma sp. TUCIM 5745]
MLWENWCTALFRWHLSLLQLPFPNICPLWARKVAAGSSPTLRATHTHTLRALANRALHVINRHQTSIRWPGFLLLLPLLANIIDMQPRVLPACTCVRHPTTANSRSIFASSFVANDSGSGKLFAAASRVSQWQWPPAWLIGHMHAIVTSLRRRMEA